MTRNVFPVAQRIVAPPTFVLLMRVVALAVAGSALVVASGLLFTRPRRVRSLRRRRRIAFGSFPIVISRLMVRRAFARSVWRYRSGRIRWRTLLRFSRRTCRSGRPLLVKLVSTRRSSRRRPMTRCTPAPFWRTVNPRIPSFLTKLLVSRRKRKTKSDGRPVSGKIVAPRGVTYSRYVR